MIFTMIAASLIPASGFNSSESDIRIQYTHTHEHEDHDHEHEADVASTQSEDESHTDQHSHELIISPAVLTFIVSKSNLAFSYSLPAKTYPKIQDDELPLSHFLNAIFRPPISA